MGRVRLPRRRRGARRGSSEHTTDSPPRHGTSRLPRLVETSADRSPGASPVSSVLAWTAPAVSFRSSARPSRSSARLPRTSAQPPTSWERRPDGLGHETSRWGAVFKDEDALSTTSARFRRSSELTPRTSDLRSRSGEACPRGRGGPFEAIGTTFWFLRTTSRVLGRASHVLGRASHVLGSLSHALGRTPEVLGNDRPYLEARSVVAVFSYLLSSLRCCPPLFARTPSLSPCATEPHSL
jgi:hypothetical protein